MPMKFWRRSVKNKFAIKDLRLLVLVFAFFGFAFQSNCQNANLAPYTKYENADQVPRITLEEAKKDYDAGTAVIIDSRPEGSYNQEHIKGSLNIPFGSPDTKFSEIPKGKKIIVYCS